MVKKWIPLEANPEVLSEYSRKLGLDTSKMSFCDVYSLDEVHYGRTTYDRSLQKDLQFENLNFLQYFQELLAFVPQPVYALLLLFPVTAAHDEEAETGECISLSIPASLDVPSTSITPQSSRRHSSTSFLASKMTFDSPPCSL